MPPLSRSKDDEEKSSLGVLGFPLTPAYQKYCKRFANAVKEYTKVKGLEIGWGRDRSTTTLLERTLAATKGEVMSDDWTADFTRHSDRSSH